MELNWIEMAGRLPYLEPVRHWCSRWAALASHTPKATGPPQARERTIPMGVFGGRNATSFKPGHKPAPRKVIGTKAQRQQHARMIADMLAKMAAANDRGEPVDPNAAVRLVNTYNRLLTEL
jgi:hypothetical protein